MTCVAASDLLFDSNFIYVVQLFCPSTTVLLTYL